MADQLKEAVEVVRDILASRGVKAEKVFLFGSRARGEAGPDSDFDLYVLVDRDLDFPARHAMSRRSSGNWRGCAYPTM